jgi:hypothetical protein
MSTKPNLGFDSDSDDSSVDEVAPVAPVVVKDPPRKVDVSKFIADAAEESGEEGSEDGDEEQDEDYVKVRIARFGTG